MKPSWLRASVDVTLIGVVMQTAGTGVLHKTTKKASARLVRIGLKYVRRMSIRQELNQMAIIMLGQWDQNMRMCIIIGMPTRAFPLSPLTVIYEEERKYFS